MGRAMPVAEEAERALVGSMMMRPELIPAAADLSGKITNPRLALVYAAIVRIHARGDPIDVAFFRSELGDDWRRIGGHQFLAELLGSVGSGHRLPEYAGLVRAAHEQRLAINDAALAADAIFRGDDEEAERHLLHMRGRSRRKSVRSKVANIVAAADYSEPLGHVATGLKDYDEFLGGGLMNGALHVVGGRTGSAKSTLVGNIGLSAASAGTRVLLFKQEEPEVEAVWRMHSSLSGVELSRIMRLGRDGLSATEIEMYDSAVSALAALPLEICDRREIGQIESEVRDFRRSGGQLVIVDQLSMVEVPDAEIGYENATKAVNRLRLLAKETKLPVVLVCQAGREASKKGKDERLGKNDLRDSGAIENDAATVTCIQTPTRPITVGMPYTMNLTIEKNRFGRETYSDDPPIELCWWPKTCRVSS